MALSRTCLISFSLALLLLHLIHANLEPHYQKAASKLVEGSLAPAPAIDCDAACSRRCQLSSRPNLCKRACGTCCARCNCVPPGTSGNKEQCPCYANMTTHGGRKKCP